MGAAAVAAAKAVGYVGAGTCEFLVDAKGSFYFLEMNTRVQVEHAITEAITGIDIVKTMIKIAAGEPHAVHAGRARDHRPRARGAHLRRGSGPQLRAVARARSRCIGRRTGSGIRVDSGVYQGATVTVYYDPMVAKLIAWGRDRAEAIERLRRALERVRGEGHQDVDPVPPPRREAPEVHRGQVRHRLHRAAHGRRQGRRAGAGQRGAARGDDARGDRRVSARQGAGRARRVPRRAAAAASAWQAYGRRSQMRGGLR